MFSFWTDLITSLENQKEQHPILFPILKQLKPVKIEKNKLFLQTDNKGVLYFLEKRKEEIELLIKNFSDKDYKIDFTLKQNKKQAKTKQKTPPLIEYSLSLSAKLVKANLNPRFTFENFAVAPTNQVAYAACQSIIETPGKVYNPLFLYGGVGVGKTHLAQATGIKIIQQHKDKKVLFSPGDQFTNELIQSIQNRSTNNFRNKYRSLDVLIIDDVQFIAGKTAVQEEFFNTFNSIVSAGGQIILISDKPPSEIKKLEQRLRSRFMGGLIVDIQNPDFELRTAIVLIKAREKNIPIDIEAAKLIAENIQDTRGLEGTLISIYAQVLNKYQQDTITFEIVSNYLNKNLVVKKTDILDVIKTVTAFYGISATKIKSSSRISEISLARQVIMYIAREKLNYKYEDIAVSLRRKDHTTIMHGVDKIKKMIIKNPNFKKEIDQILSLLDLI
ncbi:MAG: chromosomal replication initiator protein DnaA [Patescibacteria group bacterium]|nr:MAG: chromosomal replication initiator protein DnaA [Patescibacteria group bacterium]